MQAEATVNACSATSLTAMMKCAVRVFVCAYCCGLKLQPQQGEGMTKCEHCWRSSRQPQGRAKREVGTRRKWSQRFEWERSVGRQTDF